MNTRYIAALASAVLLLSPTFAFASFSDAAQRGQAQAASLTSDQLDNLNTRVVNDAFLTAKIIGYDPTEIQQLKADVAALKQENAQLRAQLQSAPATASSVPASLDARVTKLETAVDGLNSTLMLVVKMLTQVLAKL